MTLSALIRKRNTGNFATAIPAIFATQLKEEGRTVARIATVAVANPKEEKTALPAKVGVGDTVIHNDILERYPDTAAESLTPTIWQVSVLLSVEEETAIRAWLALIEETDPATVAEVIGQCRRDTNARDYFSGRAAAELPKPAPFSDDRRTCDQCANLIARRCQAAKRGGIAANRSYEPIRDLPRRCEGYVPGAADTDRAANAGRN